MDVICDIMYACIVLHNMIVEDKSSLNLDQGVEGGRMGWDLSFQELREGTGYIENMTAHFKSRNDVVEHLWQLRGESRY